MGWKGSLLDKKVVSMSQIVQYSNLNRFFSVSSISRTNSLNKSGNAVGQSNQPPNPSTTGKGIPHGPLGVPTALDKIFLVRSGQFKSANEIPKYLEGEKIHRARSWGRIRMNVGFLFLAIFSGGVMIYLGKRDAAMGRSVEKENLEWHRQNREGSGEK